MAVRPLHQPLLPLLHPNSDEEGDKVELHQAARAHEQEQEQDNEFIAGAPDGWLPQTPPENWATPLPKDGTSCPAWNEVDNPGN